MKSKYDLIADYLVGKGEQPKIAFFGHIDPVKQKVWDIKPRIKRPRKIQVKDVNQN